MLFKFLILFSVPLHFCMRFLLPVSCLRSKGTSADGPSALLFFAPLRVCVMMCLITGCNQSKNDQKELSSTTKEDGISLTVSRFQKSLSTVNLLRLTLDVEAPQGSEFSFPNEESDFGDFSYFESHISSMKLNAENKVEQKYILVLEPDLPGMHSLPALTVNYGTKSISSKPIQIEVISILKNENTEIRDLASLSTPPGLMHVIILGLLVGFIALDSALIKEEADVELDFGSEAINKISQASLADIPKIFCEFLSNSFDQKVAYTGTEALMKYLREQKLDSSLLTEIETTFRKYEESRFANKNEGSLSTLSESFLGLIKKLEGKV